MRVGWTSLICGAAGFLLGVALARTPPPQAEGGAPAGAVGAGQRALAPSGVASGAGEAAMTAPRVLRPALAHHERPSSAASQARAADAGVARSAALPAPQRGAAETGERRQSRFERAVSRRLDAMVAAEAERAPQDLDLASSEPPVNPKVQREHAARFAAGMLEGLVSGLGGDDPQAATGDPSDSQPPDGQEGGPR